MNPIESEICLPWITQPYCTVLYSLLCAYAGHTAAVSILHSALHYSASLLLTTMQASAKQRLRHLPTHLSPSSSTADGSTPSLMKTPWHGDCSDFDCAPRRHNRPATQSPVLVRGCCVGFCVSVKIAPQAYPLANDRPPELLRWAISILLDLRAVPYVVREEPSQQGKQWKAALNS